MTTKFHNIETRNGVLTKLAVLGAISIGVFVVGKRHIANNKEVRHLQETDAREDSKEFEARALKPGNPLEEGSRESKYVGAGSAYASRRKGDKFTMFNIFDRD